MRYFLIDIINSSLEGRRYRKFLAKSKLHSSEIVILATIPKTGTHLLRFLLATYCKLMTDSQHLGRGLDPMEVDEYFPSSWHTHYQNKIPSPALSDRLGPLAIKDLPRTHSVYKRAAWGVTRVIHTYRNPLDYAVTHHFAKNLMDPRGRPDCNMSASVKEALPRFVNEYLSFLNRSSNLVKRIAFEDLVANPQDEMENLLRWLGAAVNRTQIKNATKLVFEEYPWCVVGAGEKWQRNGEGKNSDLAEQFLEHAYRLKGVGVWKNYLDADDVNYVRSYLDNYGIENHFDFR